MIHINWNNKAVHNTSYECNLDPCAKGETLEILWKGQILTMPDLFFRISSGGYTVSYRQCLSGKTESRPVSYQSRSNLSHGPLTELLGNNNRQTN